MTFDELRESTHSARMPMAALVVSLLPFAASFAQSPPPERVLSIAEERSSATIFQDIEASSEPEEISIHWIDTGITFKGEGAILTALLNPPALLNPEFLEELWRYPLSLLGRPPLRTEYYPSLFGVPEAGQIVVRMPERRSAIFEWYQSLTPEEWSVFGKSLEANLYRQIKTRRAKGLKEIEIRTVEVINAAGYFDPRQQARAEEFIKVFLTSMSRVRQLLEREQNKVTVTAACGSNGCSAASLAIPLLNKENMHPVDAMLMFDGRAHCEDADQLIDALGEKVAIINTAGDAPSLGGMIANLACSRSLKARHPHIRVFFAANPKGWFGMGLPFTRHIIMMQSVSISDVKELLWSYRQFIFWHDSYQKLGRLSGSDLKSLALRSWGAEPGQSRMAKRKRRDTGIRNEPKDNEAGGCDPQSDGWCVTSNKFLPFFPACPPWLPDCWLALSGNPPCNPKMEGCEAALDPVDPPCLPGEDCRQRDPERALSRYPMPDFLRYSVWPFFKPIPDLTSAPSPAVEILISQ